ncbi:MAG: ATP-binding protein [Kouleothrix sp.]|nr:ATP-binding protein [Kouleothrix sp.]
MDRLSGELPLRVELGLGATDGALVPPDTGAELVRIVGEAVRNAVRHGQASAVQIRFQCHDRVACLSISDDGGGFDMARSPADGRGHFGLSVMRARAARIGGELSIASQPGRGTRIQVRWPVASAAT